MDCVLTREKSGSNGIFGVLRDPGGDELAQTLEHAFKKDGYWVPKLPNGTYTCIRGEHRLEGMDHSFPTFEITGVPGHSGILFHWGNWNKDSDGCVLLGQVRANSVSGPLVTNSRNTFASFMELQDGIDQFQLTVK